MRLSPFLSVYLVGLLSFRGLLLPFFGYFPLPCILQHSLAGLNAIYVDLWYIMMTSSHGDAFYIDNKLTLVQVMAWRRTGDKPLSEPMLTRFIDAYMRHYGEMSYLLSSSPLCEVSRLPYVSWSVTIRARLDATKLLNILHFEIQNENYNCLFHFHSEFSLLATSVLANNCVQLWPNMKSVTLGYG